MVLPFFHVTSMQGGMNAPIYQGSTIVLMCRWDRDLAAELIQRYRLMSWTAISTMVIDFLANPRLSEYDLSSLQRMSGGGAAMPAAVGERLQQLIGSPYIEGYGLTETIAPTHINPPERAKRQCLGIPIFNTDSRVIDPDTLHGAAAGPGRRDRLARTADLPRLLAQRGSDARCVHRARGQEILSYRRSRLRR